MWREGRGRSKARKRAAAEGEAGFRRRFGRRHGHVYGVRRLRQGSRARGKGQTMLAGRQRRRDDDELALGIGGRFGDGPAGVLEFDRGVWRRAPGDNRLPGRFDADHVERRFLRGGWDGRRRGRCGFAGAGVRRRENRGPARRPRPEPGSARGSSDGSSRPRPPPRLRSPPPWRPPKLTAVCDGMLVRFPQRDIVPERIGDNAMSCRCHVRSPE